MTLHRVQSDIELLRSAVEANDLSALKKVLENSNVDMQGLSNDITESVSWSASEGKWNIVEYLLQPCFMSHYINAINELDGVFQSAISNGYLPVINRLLEPDCLALGFSPSVNDNKAIRRTKYLYVLNRLLQPDCIMLGVDPAADCNMELMRMIENESFHDIVLRLLQEKRVRDTLSEEQCVKVNEFLAANIDSFSQYITYDYPIIPGAGFDVAEKLPPIYYVMYEYFPEMREEYFHPNGKPKISNQETYLFNIWLQLPDKFKIAMDNNDLESIKKISGFAEWSQKQEGYFTWVGAYKFWLFNLQNHPKLVNKMLPWYSPDVIKSLFYGYHNYNTMTVEENKEYNPGYEELHEHIKIFAERRLDPSDNRNPKALRPIDSKKHLYLQNTYWTGEIDELLAKGGYK